MAEAHEAYKCELPTTGFSSCILFLFWYLSEEAPHASILKEEDKGERALHEEK